MLDGRTTSATVGLITADLEPFTGARWLALPVPNAPSQVFLQCLGDDDGPRFLNGGTEDGKVGLAPSTEDPFSGTRWEVSSPAGKDTVFLECRGASTGGVNARVLHGNLGEGTVGLVHNKGDAFSATQWNIVNGQPIPSGGPGATSATSQPTSTPSLALFGLGHPGPPVVYMAWQASDGRVSVMQDVLSNAPRTISLSHVCRDRPALAFDNTPQSDHKLYLAWTGLDQRINVMSSAGGLVFSGKKILPGISLFGPAIAVHNKTLVVAWTDADTGALKMMMGVDAPVLTTTETSSAAPALASEPVILAWTGTNAERQLNVMVFQPPPFSNLKTTLPSDGPSAATSMSGPSLDFKVEPRGGALVMGWSGLPGGPDHDNHLNIISSGASSRFSLFGGRRTVAPVSSGGVAILDTTKRKDGDVFAAWVDKNSPDARIITAPSYNQLPVISA